MDIRKQVGGIASLSGINIGVSCVFREYQKTWSIYSLGERHKRGNKEDRQEGEKEIKLVFGVDNGYSCSFIIPSKSQQTDLRHALKIFKDGKCYLDHNTPFTLRQPVLYSGEGSILRVYRDIFPLFNEWINQQVPLETSNSRDKLCIPFIFLISTRP